MANEQLKFLDKVGLTYFWGKIKNYVNSRGFGEITQITSSNGITGSGTSGTVNISHSNSVTAQTTQAIYPITIDAQGHIDSYGNAVTIPSEVTENTVSNWGFTKNTGTVESVRVQATGPVLSSQNTAQTGTLNTTISLDNYYGDTQNPYNNKNANLVLASPDGTAGQPTFRSLSATDIPQLTISKLSDFPATMPPTSHTHGYISDGGDVTGTSTVAAGDQILIRDNDLGKVAASSITFGTDTEKFLANNGSWQTFKTVGGQSIVGTGNIAVTASIVPATSTVVGGILSGGDVTVSNTGAVTVNNATASTTATTATNSNKIKTVKVDHPTSGYPVHFLTFVDSNNTTSTFEDLKTNAGIFYEMSSTYSMLDVGVRGSKMGYIRLENGANSEYYAQISTGSNALTASRSFTLPDKGGTFALTSDIVDTKVAQTETTTSAAYEVLFSGTADNTTRTEGSRKSAKLTFNPSSGALTSARTVTVGSDTAATENYVMAKSNSGTIYIDSVGSADGKGNRGLYIDAHGTATSGKWAVKVDTNNNVTLNGNATSATTATNATNATNADNVAITNMSTSSNATYYPTFVTPLAAADRALYNSDVFRLDYNTTTPYALLAVGKASSTRGYLRLHDNASAYHVQFLPKSGLTGSRSITVPDATGTLALTSDITSAVQALDVSSVGGTGKYISTISQADGKISATAASTSVSVAITAGTSSATPKVNVTVNGVSGTAQSITTASTSVYGATKLDNSGTSTSTALAATAASVAKKASVTISSSTPSGTFNTGDLWIKV